MSAEATVRAHLAASAALYGAVAAELASEIASGADMVARALRGDGKLLLCGNGGSAADCQHIAAEFTNRLTKDFVRPALPALALTVDGVYMTAFANDYGYEGVFARQVEALGRPGDLLIAISTSGGSPSVLRAAEAAAARRMPVLSLMGRTGALAELSTLAIRVPSDNTQHVQEVHLAIAHVVCSLAERALFEPGESG